MAESFDPYRKWLGIPPHEQPPTHYRLLGIGPFEDDPDVIENAANRQMAHVRTFQTGRHSKVSQRILNELSAARLCLLNPEKKRQYDERLQSQTVAAPPPPPSPPAQEGASPPMHAGMGPPVGHRTAGAARPAGLPVGRSSVRRRAKSGRSSRVRGTASRRHRRPVRRRSSSFPIVLGLIVVAILIGILVIVLNRNWSKPADSSLRRRDSAAPNQPMRQPIHHATIQRACDRLCLAGPGAGTRDSGRGGGPAGGGAG